MLLTQLYFYIYYIVRVKSTLLQRFERLFADLGINQMDVSRKTGFTQPYISQILSGTKTNPSRRFYYSVSREFNVNPEWLITGNGDIYTAPGETMQSEIAETMAKYCMLPQSEQQIIDDMINALLVKNETDEEKTAVRKTKKKATP